MSDSDTKETSTCCESEAKPLGFFGRIFASIDGKMKAKADEQASSGSCCCSCDGDKDADKGGGKCC